MFFSPYVNRVRRVLGNVPEFWSLAEEVWDVSPAEERSFPAAFFLQGQLERITGTVFGDLAGTLEAFRSDRPRPVGATLAARFRDVILEDGVLYKGAAENHLLPRQKRSLLQKTPDQVVSGTIYDSWIGLRYFGNWLMDDCETYRLAEQVGNPITLRQNSPGHRGDYERLLSMKPARVASARFEELVLFADLPNNTGKLDRAADRRARLTAGRPQAAMHPGIFLLRGNTGDPRRLLNEQKLAEHMASRHGFTVLQAEDHTVAELITAAEGARILIGVEGSQLTHALAVMPPGGTMVSLMPPDRVTAAMKLMTDRLGLTYAVVIGSGSAEGFHISLDEVDATLDMLS